MTILLLGALIFLTAKLNEMDTRTAEGRAVIIDGDSIELGGQRIRLRGIDAPEYRQMCSRNGADYACGRAAREALARLTLGRTVTCSGWRNDRYGRLLGDCAAGGTDLNSAQVAAGWAVAYGDFEREEPSARAARAGIWAGTFDWPQDWRAAENGRVEPKHDLVAAFGDWLERLWR
ncbi:thermonuclease family protein [Mesorhizobium sp. Root157]|uniref:thermonuclease family protein n=1 Tax=Mesorhizobium sp. Root157 TaxID=1736477 RepID=UPI001FCD8E00|nr:thermonuclease family protein [Mesorhizobium sp. Root157]